MSRSQAGLPSDPSGHLVYQALLELGSQCQDAKAVADRVQRLSLGLPAEDELSVVLSWLGKCRLVHKLDQEQVPPALSSPYRVPDLLAIFSYDGREVPVLIEVKTGKSKSLSWRPDFIDGLKRYGDALGLPVLVAWKIPSFGLWTLVDLESFQRSKTNYKLTYEMALKDNLLGVLAGDFMVWFPPGFGMRIHLEVDQSLSHLPPDEGDSAWVDGKITDAYFFTPSGERLSGLVAGLWTLFIASGLEEETVETENGFQITYVVPPDRVGTWAHLALIALLTPSNTAKSLESAIHWRKIFKSQEIPISVAALADAAQAGFGEGTVRYIFHLRPNVMPAFLDIDHDQPES